MHRPAASPIKLLAILEASTVTGVAKNVLDFCQCVRHLNQKAPGSADVESSLVTFDRRRAPQSDESEMACDEAANELVSVTRELGINIDVIRERFRFDLRVVPALRRIVNERAPDIIVTHNQKSHFLMRFSGLWRRYPWVAFHHGYTTTDLKMRAYNQLNRWSLPAADRVVTVCRAFAQELEKEGVPDERIFVQHNSINAVEMVRPEDALSVRAGLGVEQGESLVLAIGRLSREKAHVDLVQAFAHLRRAHPEIKAKLVIVGDGPERSRIEAAAATLGIGERVLLTGQLSDVRPYYAAADLFVLPSHSEGSPYVLLEAMAARIPIVATAVGGVPEMVENEESALLVAPRAPQAMASAMARLLTDTELAHQLVANASALVATRYSPEAYVRSLVKIYRELLPGTAIRGPQALMI
jgi:glycosyltransferase involved in cell wall biosynthesis